MKKVIGIVTILLMIAGGAYMYLRFHVLKVKDFKPEIAKEKNVVDLRPALIAKLQQLVKDGSDGLYILHIDSIETDVLHGKADVFNASVSIDSVAMHALDKSRKLPDDIFKLKLNDLHITGLGIDNFLHKDSVDITSIHIDKPIIQVYHELRSYNIAQRKADEKLPLYEKILHSMKSIGIGDLNISHGTFTLHQKSAKQPVTHLNDVSIRLGHILIDSLSQFDKNRFLFAKEARFEAKNYFLPTPDSLYVFSVGSIAVSADQHTLNAGNIRLTAKGGKAAFEKKLKFRKEMYDVSIPKLTMKGVNWWSIINNEKWLSKEIDLFDPKMYVYLDPTIPPSKVIHTNNFPHQLIMKLGIPIAVAQLNLHNFKVAYEEYNPRIKRSGTVHFDGINGSITHISNIPEEVKKFPVSIATARGKFMNATPIKTKMTFYLNKQSTGDFSVDVEADTLNNFTINPVAEPLAQFTIKKGQFIKGVGHIEGNNFQSKGTIAVQYRDLHITPLRSDSNDEGKLRKHPIISFLANKLLIKDNNPGADGILRKPAYIVDRDHHGNFFNFIWLTIMTGVLKTIGIPVKLIIK